MDVNVKQSWTSGLRRGLAGLGLAAAGAAAQASVIPLPGTGVNGSGTPLSAGSVDSHWQVVAGPGITAPVAPVVVSNTSPYYNQPDSAWIWLNATGVAAFNTPYTFQLQFDLTGLDPASVVLSGLWGVDNLGSILLNGAAAVGTGTLALNTVTTATFNSPNAFTINSGFLAGLNTLSFVVTDAGVIGALNVDHLQVAGTPLQAVPEPATAGLLALPALALLGVARRRRRG